MLAELRVRDLAILERVDLSFDAGLNVISGETGEGKSLLLLAVTLLLGERSRRGLVRAGAKEATIEGRFLLDPGMVSRLADGSDLISPDATEVVLRRTVLEDGTSRASIDGRLATVSTVARVAQCLVDLHAQGQTQALERLSERARLLDHFGGHGSLTAAYRQEREQGQQLETRIHRLRSDQATHEQRLDFLQFQVQELEELAPEAGEETSVAQSLKLAARAESIERVCDDIAGSLVAGDGSWTEHLARWRRQLGEVAEHPGFSSLADRLLALETEVADLGATASDLRRAAAGSGESVEDMEERLAALRRIARKHRVDGDHLPERLRALQDELATIQSSDANIEALVSQSEQQRVKTRAAAESLLAARYEVARRLEAEVVAGLSELRMERAKFRIDTGPRVLPQEWTPPEGDEPGMVQFLVTPNPGEPEQPIERVASGGELSRILLAIKGALAGVHRIPLLVFDEVDAGIGGRIGLSFGRRIAAMAVHHQVLVVTHLPQVAAFAKRHFRVRKHVEGERTRTEVSVLSAEDRVVEIAEMLGLNAKDAGARRQSKALLSEAQA